MKRTVFHVDEPHSEWHRDIDRPTLRRFVQTGPGSFTIMEGQGKGQRIATDPLTYKPNKGQAWRSYLTWKRKEAAYSEHKAAKHRKDIETAKTALRNLEVDK